MSRPPTEVSTTMWIVKSVQKNILDVRRGDGDTVWLLRSTIQRLGDRDFYVQDVDYMSVRLVWVNTPERGKPGYRAACDELTEWLDRAMAMGTLRVYIYDGGAGWDRLLGDVVNARGESASQHMMIERGWPAYEGKGVH